MGAVSNDLIKRLLADSDLKDQYVDLLKSEVARLRKEGTAGLPEDKRDILLDTYEISGPGTP